MTGRRHHVQQHILELLMQNPSQRYSQLRPAHMEPNQFVYHLKQLVREGMVQKCGDGYELTSRGRAYADKFDPVTNALQWEIQPRSVLFLAVRQATRGWLLTRRDRQPTIGRVGFISCDPELGVPVEQTASTFIQQSRGADIDFEYAFSGSTLLRSDEQVESFAFFQVLVATVADERIAGPADTWYLSHQLDQPDILPSTPAIIRNIVEPPATPAFLQLEYDLG